MLVGAVVRRAWGAGFGKDVQRVQPVCESCYLPMGSWRPLHMLKAKGGFMLPGSMWICWGREGDNAAHKKQGALLEMNLIFLILVKN